MLAPVSWLSRYVDINVSMPELDAKLTMTGTKVEEIVPVNDDIKNVLVGRIIKIEKHPDAERLQICQVDIGERVIQIVTAATNVFEGALVPVAVAKAHLPNDVTITKGKLRGVVSEGMFCSGEELRINDSDYEGASVNGILILKEDYPLGSDVCDDLMLRDNVVDFEITPNRSDCLCMTGIAREIGVTFGERFNYPELPEISGEGDVNDFMKVTISAPDLCGRYCCGMVKDVKLAPSPMWMRRALAMAGVRPINNIVDITNFVMLELGQPMHAFDERYLRGNMINVRRAAVGESIVTLDGVERKLDTDMLVICDAERPVALAGIMGGENSEIMEDTKTVLFECAWFDENNVDATSKKLGLTSEAESRFARRVDKELAIKALRRAMALVKELNAGTVVGGCIDVYPGKEEPHVIKAPADRVNGLLGTDLSIERMAELLRSIEFGVDIEGDVLVVTCPSFRHDVEGVADVAEEVVRLFGFDDIPMTLLSHGEARGKRTPVQKLEAQAKQILVGAGAYEITTPTYHGESLYERLGKPVPAYVKILNPQSSECSVMRTELVGSMVTALEYNFKHQRSFCRLFELGHAFIPGESVNVLPTQKTLLCLGQFGGKSDFYELKSALMLVLENMGIAEKVRFLADKDLPGMHPGRTADIAIGDELIGFIGELLPAVCNNFGVAARLAVAQLDWDRLAELAVPLKHFEEISRFPMVTRDIAVLVGEELPVAELRNVILEAGRPLLIGAELLSVYQGEQIPAGMKSVAWTLDYQSTEHTLSEDEINAAHGKVREALERKLGATLR